MSETEKRLAESLSADDIEIIPYLPYILQDLWELGSSPKDIIDLIKKNVLRYKNLRVLDLACGKGAVAVQLARAINAKVKGIDIIPEFIEYAEKKAEDYSVSELCEFQAGDINKSVKIEKDYDVVIFAAGNVLGKPSETLKILSQLITPQGYIVFDETISYDGSLSPSRKQWLKFFDENGLKLIAEKSANENEMIMTNKANMDFIIQRSEELISKYPEKEDIFRDYIERQQEECEILESEVIAVTFLLQKK